MIKSLLITIALLALLFGFCSLGVETVLKTGVILLTIMGFISMWGIIHAIIEIKEKLNENN